MSKGSSGGGGGTGGGPAVKGRPASTRSAGRINYTKSERSVRNGDVLVKVSVSKMDKAWAKDPSGSRAGVDRGREAGARQFIESGRKVNAPEASYDRRTGSVSFRDGRHRFRAVRDSGRKSIVVAVPRSQAKRFRRQFGAR